MIYSDIHLGDEGEQWLREWAEGNDVPLRVVRGRAGARLLTPIRWTAGHAEVTGYSLAECEERGVTIYDWATAHGHSRTEGRTLVIPHWIDGEDDHALDVLSYDVLSAEESDETSPFGYELDGERYELGEASERNVYFHFPLSTIAGYMYDAEHVFSEALDLALNAGLDDEDRAARERARFEQWAADMPERQLADSRRAITALEANVAMQSQSLMQTLHQLRDKQREVDARLEAMRHTPTEWLDMWATISSHPRVTNVGFSGGGLHIITDTMVMTHPQTGEQRTLGRMKFTIDLNARRPVSIRNLDFPRKGRPHPHVGESGNACFGEMTETVQHYAAEFELVALLEILIQYCESFNPADDYGRFAAYWFDAPDVTEQVPDAEVVA